MTRNTFKTLALEIKEKKSLGILQHKYEDTIKINRKKNVGRIHPVQDSVQWQDFTDMLMALHNA